MQTKKQINRQTQNEHAAVREIVNA